LIRCPTLEDMTETTLAFMPGRFPKAAARRSWSTRWQKGLICDHCDELKTNLAQLSDKTKEAVRPLIPAELAVENPLECGVRDSAMRRVSSTSSNCTPKIRALNLLAIHGELPRARSAALICSERHGGHG